MNRALAQYKTLEIIILIWLSDKDIILMQLSRHSTSPLNARTSGAALNGIRDKT